jgi:hypothetical protein
MYDAKYSVLSSLKDEFNSSGFMNLSYTRTISLQLKRNNLHNQTDPQPYLTHKDQNFQQRKFGTFSISK